MSCASPLSLVLGGGVPAVRGHYDLRLGGCPPVHGVLRVTGIAGVFRVTGIARVLILYFIDNLF